MKKLILFSSFILSIGIKASSGQWAEAVLDSKADSIVRANMDMMQDEKVLVYIDYYNCQNCNAGLDMILTYSGMKQKKNNYKYVFGGLPAYKQNQYVKNIYKDEHEVLKNEYLSNFFLKIFNTPPKNSKIIRYDSISKKYWAANINTSTPDEVFNFFTNKQNAEIKRDSTILNDGNLDIYGINTFNINDSEILVKSKNGGNLFFFNEKGGFKTQIIMDTNLIRKEFYDLYVKNMPEEFKEFNKNIDLMELYDKEYKSMNVPFFQHIRYYTDTKGRFYTVSVVSLPYCENDVNYLVLNHQFYLLKYNDKKEMTEKTYIPFYTNGKYSCDFYNTFHLENKQLSFALTQYETNTDDTVFLQASGNLNKNAFKIDKEVYLLNRQIDSAFSYKKGYFKYDYKFLNDTLLYFEYIPCLLDVKNKKPYYINTNNRLGIKDSIDFSYACFGAYISKNTVTLLTRYNSKLSRIEYNLRNGETEEKIEVDFKRLSFIKGSMEINMDKENIYLLTQDNNKGLILYKIRQKDFY